VALLDVPPYRRPRTLAVAVTAVGLEVLALVTVGVAHVVDAVAGRAGDAGQFAATGTFALLVAGLLGLAARALWQLRRWGRGPIVTWQLLQGLVGVSLLDSVWAPAAVLLIVLAVVTVFATLAPPSVRALSPGSRVDAAVQRKERHGTGRLV
jgi:hypothetical protein